MLTTLKLMGALDGIAGFIFGECTDCDPGDGYGSLTLDQIFDDHIKPLGIPAYRGAMIGHIRKQFIVPVGGMVELDADAGSFRMRSEEHTSELQSLMRNSYAVFCLKKTNIHKHNMIIVYNRIKNHNYTNK